MPNFLAEDDEPIEYLDPIDAAPRPFKVPPRKPMATGAVPDAPPPRPIGAGNQPTIRELLNPVPEGPPLTSEMESANYTPPSGDTEMTGMVERRDKAQERANLLGRAKPTAPEPKWWQRALAGAAGGLAGYTNASGRTKVDPSGAIAGIYGAPKLARDTANWQGKSEQADAEAKQAEGNLTSLQRMRKLKSDEESAQVSREHTKAQTAAMPEATLLAAVERGGELIPEGQDAPTDREGSVQVVSGKKVFFPSKGQQAKEKKVAEQENWRALPKAITDALQMDEGTKVPASDMDSYIRMVEAGRKDNNLHFETHTDDVTGDVTTRGYDTKTGDIKFAHTSKGEARKRPQISINNGGQADDAKMIAAGILNGDQPPDTKGLYRYGAAVRAELERNGYNLAGAQRDWQAINRHLATLNGQQQEKLRQAISFTHDSVGQIENLYDEWQKTGLPTGFKSINKAALVAASHLPGQTGAVAQALLTQINDLTSELGTVYKGGNGSTDESLRLAGENLKGEWNKETFERAVKQLKVNLTIRKNSILTSQPAGVSPNSPYLPNQTPNPSANAGGGRGGNPNPNGYVVGHVYAGKTYLGGDPNSAASWR